MATCNKLKNKKLILNKPKNKIAMSKITKNEVQWPVYSM